MKSYITCFHYIHKKKGVRNIYTFSIYKSIFSLYILNNIDIIFVKCFAYENSLLEKTSDIYCIKEETYSGFV